MDESKTITATYKTSPAIELSLSANKIAAGDKVKIAGLGKDTQGKPIQGSLAWQPAGLFALTSPQTVKDGDELEVSSSTAGTYQLSLTVGANAPIAYLRVSPGHLSLLYFYYPGVLMFDPINAVASPGDVLGFSRISGLDATLSWDDEKSLFKDVTGTSTPVKSDSQLVVAAGAQGRYPLTLSGSGSPLGRGNFYVRAISVRYNNSPQLGVVPTPYVNKGDQVIIENLPSGYSATLSWTTKNLFVGYSDGGSVEVHDGRSFTVSNGAQRGMATLTLEFKAIPAGGTEGGGVGLSRADGNPDVIPTMAAGTLDPTGDGDVVP